METHTLTAVERYTNIRERVRLRLHAEGAKYDISRAVDLLLLELLTWMISWAAERSEWRLQQQACVENAGVEPGCSDAAGGLAAPAADAGADRRGNAGCDGCYERRLAAVLAAVCRHTGAD